MQKRLELYAQVVGIKGGGSEVIILDEPLCMASPQANAEIMRGGCPTLNTIHEQPIMLSNRKGNYGMTEDGTSTTLNAQEKERPMIAEGGDAMTSVVRRLTPLE